MPFFGIIWVTSWVSCLLASGQVILKVPEHLASALPAKVFSLVSNPIELPPPKVFPQQTYSDIQSYPLSVAALHNLTFEFDTGNFSVRHQQVTRALLSSSRLSLDQVQYNVYRLDSKPKRESVSSALTASSSSDWQQTASPVYKTNDETKLYRRLFNMVRNFWSKPQPVEPAKKAPPESVVVISTRSWERVGEKPKFEEGFVKLGFWWYSQLLKARALAAQTDSQGEYFQVWLKGHLIAQLPHQQQATVIAESLKKLFLEPSYLHGNSSDIEPAIMDGLPVVKLGKRLLFKVDRTLARDLENNQKILAIEWANNLRVAMGKAPLELVEAQKRMYNLVETQKTVQGVASWYGPYFHGRITATGETYNQNDFTAAHLSLPFGTYLKVRNLRNGETVIVRINDRGPYIDGRNLDLSREAARSINSENVGIVPYEAVIMKSPIAKPDPDVVTN
ncbi:septal ring lytic transglycosylase RlpA family protein [Lyngbya aestuarii]|uniref:septal ring lytic transglycosylase RlpA family protein n=1 Tax=Lyngbya aestuarii TaxID=118322 RepID=UPI00403DF21C